MVLSKFLEFATTKRLGATFVDLHTALMGPGVNLRAALRLIDSIEQLCIFGDNWGMLSKHVSDNLHSATPL